MRAPRSIEYLVPIADKRRVRRHRLIATDDGPVVRVVAFGVDWMARHLT